MEVRCSCGAAYTFDYEVTGHTFTCRCGRRLTTGASNHAYPEAPAAADLLARVADETAGRRSGDRLLAVLVAVAVAVLLLAGVIGFFAGQRNVQTPTTGTARPNLGPLPQSQPATPAAVVPARPRLDTGTILAGTVGSEHYGVLRVINGTAGDALIKLLRQPASGQELLFYVRAGDTAVMEGIADGVYSLRFATNGAVWNPSRQSVSGGTRFRFDRVFDFETQETLEGVSYTEHEVTLHTVTDGNLRARPISASDF